jgi:hypothetical protein
MNTIALFAASLILGATSATLVPGAWIQVAGGAWVPNEAVVSQVASSLEVYVEAAAKRQGRDVRPWSEYSFQYQGRILKGRRYVFIAGLCATFADTDLSADFYEVLDGGSCYFRLTFDPKRQRFGNLHINAIR